MRSNTNNSAIKLLGIMTMALILSGCTKALNKESLKQDSKGVNNVEQGITTDSPEYVEVSTDDSIDTLDKELEETFFEEEDFSDLGI
jgi:hypothetical protein